MPRVLMILAGQNGTAPLPAAPDGLDPDTLLTFRRAAAAPPSLASAQDWALADLAVLAAGQTAESEGFDAVCVAELGDFGASALRSVLGIPVIAAGRSAMLFALGLGTRFSLLVPDSGRHRAKKLVAEYGLERQCASVRASRGEPAALVEAARRSIEEDGADVLCLATGPGGGSAARLAEAVGVPVVDPLALAPKLAESLLGLGLGHSRRAWPEPMTRKAGLVEALAAAAAKR